MNKVLKRLLDLFVSIAILSLFSWLLLFFFIFACIETKSFGVFSQVRVGRHMKPFHLYKIKSMKKIEGYDSTTTMKADPRITWSGHIIRKTKIDELPQLINVLIGNMSLVGPRPTVMSDYKRMSESQRKRADVKPGLTGLAQINGNTSLNWPKRIEFDLKYVNNWTFLMDIQILWKTAVLVFTNSADTHPASDDEWN